MKYFLKSKTVKTGLATIVGAVLTTIITGNANLNNYIAIENDSIHIKIEHLVELATLLFTGVSGVYTVWNRIDPNKDNEILYTPKGLPGANKEDVKTTTFEVLK